MFNKQKLKYKTGDIVKAGADIRTIGFLIPKGSDVEIICVNPIMKTYDIVMVGDEVTWMTDVSEKELIGKN